ncbi:hypothetical protein [Caproicibacter sp.]|uniref:hypothetical protein n=1 Tax=Caproicibacter sp. TaxID=2814884 RepID=UPI0039897929
MKRNTRMETERKSQNLVVTGSRTRKTWEEPENTDLDEELYSAEADDFEPQPDPINRRASTKLLTVVQISACTAILIAAVALRLNGGTVYQKVRNWYFESLNDSIVADSQMENMKHVVIDLWSNITSSRPENTQEASSAPDQPSNPASQASSAGSANGAGSAPSQPENASAPASSGTQTQPNGASALGSAPQSENNASASPSSQGKAPSSSASP